MPLTHYFCEHNGLGGPAVATDALKVEVPAQD